MYHLCYLCLEVNGPALVGCLYILQLEMTTILVTGATGKQGGSVIESLLEKKAPFKILAVTRDASSPAAKKLAEKSPNVTLIQGNLSSPATIFEEVERQTSTPIWGVFGVHVSLPRQSPTIH